MTLRPPVTDWTSDWDHLDPSWLSDPYSIWRELREACPVAHTGRYRGVYFPTRYSDIREIAYDPAHFSSRRVVVREGDYRVNSPPITSDPPDHRPLRMVLIPPFTPQAVAALEGRTRAVCNELIDAFIENGIGDGAVDYAQHIPVRIIAHMLGIPASDGDRFRGWITMALQDGITNQAALKQAEEEIAAYFVEQIRQRRGQVGEDLVSFLIQARQPNGEAFSDHQVLGALRLLLVAGTDTTWSAIGSAIWHLATVPADRERLVREPELIPTAIEELLRAYAPVTMAREIVDDVAVGGCPMKRGEMVLLSFPAANRDPGKFPDADKVVIDRKENPHVAFGLGIHRCIGSNLARMEMRVAVEEWLRRIPEFRLDPSRPMTWSQGTVRGPRLLPIVFG
ncbi:cytochrome P450 [Bradyrhizobium sp. AUGA SZCCT0222]|uniref:cytochrome P450 n=1 Tax=Bradyrhizobium sp. AUGA SZCCT0222 TaxID=2807668 RepID=UPI001BAC6E98|nr:cytochrome P450 [Bradyrhizobium sp. AUGA SZCCT0222]MBR1266770.1 cytochrome P450 [Bradyrhizobium sp. AUGA SZCCT0222]